MNLEFDIDILLIIFELEYLLYFIILIIKLFKNIYIEDVILIGVQI